MKIAIVETKPSRNNWARLFNGAFDFQVFNLCDDPNIKKVLKADVTLDLNPDDYDWIITVGADVFKFYTKMSGITEYTGCVVKEKFLPCINPAMLHFNPSLQKTWDKTRDNIISYINGEKTHVDISNIVEGITDKNRALEYIQEAIDYKDFQFFAIDSETSSLYPRDGYVLGISLTYKQDYGVYIDSSIIDEEVEEKLQELINKKIAIFHNAKFDLAWLEYHFNVKFGMFHDTMLMHYCLDETPGTHGLKSLAIKFTPYGDYERPLEEFKTEYQRKHGIKKADFSYDLIPFDVMYPYASMDTVVTFLLFRKFHNQLSKNKKLNRVYKHLLIPGCRFLCDIQENGIPFSKERLLLVQARMEQEIQAATTKLKNYKEVIAFEKAQGKEFNPNSTIQLRRLLFDYLGLPPTGIKTEKGEPSTNAEALQALASMHEIPDLILTIRKKSKIKNTYIDKIIPELDRDSRLRTNFNQHVTTSGRLSSSGKLNAQQLPRDDPSVKGCIQARPGYKIVAMDLTTAEMYYAAALSGDKTLCDIFRSGENFHSSVAKEVFNLPCEVSEVADLYKTERQATKAINFGIVYGAGGHTISASILKDTGTYIDPDTCDDYIAQYFARFRTLKNWLRDTRDFIQQNGYIYSFFGRKRRLGDVFSRNKGIASHEVRSGLNFVIQSLASDINVLAGIEMNNWIQSNPEFDAKIFALVHDSILAEVRDDLVDEYVQNLRSFVQKDRGVSITGAPIGCDFEVSQDYSMYKNPGDTSTKFELVYDK